jgi:hypothetical protein
MLASGYKLARFEKLGSQRSNVSSGMQAMCQVYLAEMKGENREMSQEATGHIVETMRKEKECMKSYYQVSLLILQDDDGKDSFMISCE